MQEHIHSCEVECGSVQLLTEIVDIVRLVRILLCVQQQRAGAHCRVVYQKSLLVLLTFDRYACEYLRNLLRCIEFARLFAGFTRELSDKILVSVAENIALMSQEICVVDSLDKFSNYAGLLLFTRTEPC